MILLLASLATAAPDASRAWPVVLELSDPDGLLGAAPLVSVTDADGQARDMLPRDDGESPDAKPGDRIYTHPLPKLPAGALTVRVRAGTAAWSGGTDIVEDGGGTLVVRLAADGTATVTSEADTEVSGAFDLGAPTRTMEEFRGGFLLWAVLLAGFGVGVGSVVAERGRKGRGPVRLAPTESVPIAPFRLSDDPATITAALTTLSGHRVVCAGALEAAPPHVVPCVEAGPLPGELVAAVEALAARPGPPVALLVTDLAALDAPGGASTAEALAVAVAGRFPLYVVGGPAAWAAYPPTNG